MELHRRSENELKYGILRHFKGVVRKRGDHVQLMSQFLFLFGVVSSIPLSTQLSPAPGHEVCSGLPVLVPGCLKVE